jgi:hypothetical protein
MCACFALIQEKQCIFKPNLKIGSNEKMDTPTPTDFSGFV